MKVYWGVEIYLPSFFDLGTRWRWVVIFMPGPLYPQGKNPWYSLNRRLDGPWSYILMPMPWAGFKAIVPVFNHSKPSRLWQMLEMPSPVLYAFLILLTGLHSHVDIFLGNRNFALDISFSFSFMWGFDLIQDEGHFHYHERLKHTVTKIHSVSRITWF